MGHRALAALFAALGVATGAWGVHIPSLKARHDLDEGTLAIALLAAGLGAICSMLASGPVVARLGTRLTLQCTGFLMFFLLSAVLWWPSWSVLLFGLFALGMCISVHDVALNAEGTSMEQRLQRPIMGRLHGLFSLGAMTGALLCAVMLQLQWAAAVQLAAISAGLSALLVMVGPRLLNAHPRTAEREGQRHFVWPRGSLLLIGVLIFAGMLAEGVMMDWTVLYLQTALVWPQERAAVGYAVFVGAMAAARLGADRARSRWGDERLLLRCAGLATLSMALALLWPNPVASLLCLAGVGIGLAPVVPLLYTAASRVPGSSSAAALAAASAIGYSGFLVGPPLIGGLAQAYSLPLAMWVVVLAAALLAFGARSRLPT